MKTINKKSVFILVLSLVIAMSLFVTACKKPAEKQPDTGTIKEFGLIAPANNGLDVATAPQFSWQDAEADRYSLLISKQQDFGKNVVERHNIKDTSYQLDYALEYDTTYYWKVRATSGDTSKESKEIFSFKTGGSSIKLETQVFEDFSGYDIANTGLFNSIHVPHASGDALTATLMNDGAFGNGQYLKMNFSINSADKGWSQLVSGIPFRLKYSSGISFKLKLPVALAGNTMFFSIREASEEVWRKGIPLTYTDGTEIKIPFAEFERSGTAVSNNILDFSNYKSLGFSFTGNNIAINAGEVFIDEIKTYIDESIDTGKSPAAFSLGMPKDDAQKIDLNPVFMWNPSENAFSYDLAVSTDANFSNIILSAKDILKTSYSFVTALGYETEYFWKVTAKGYTGRLDSAAMSFVTRNGATYIIDDFESFETDTQLTNVYKAEVKASPINVTLDKNGGKNGNALKLDYRISSGKLGFAMVTKTAAMNFTGFTGIQFGFRMLTNVDKMFFTFGVINDQSWRAELNTTALTDGKNYIASIPFSAFILKDAASGVFNYDKISSMSFSFSGNDGKSGCVLIDNIKCYYDTASTDITVLPEDEEPVGNMFRVGAPCMDNMVIQRGKPISIWGYAAQGIIVDIDFNGQTKSAVATAAGKFSATFDGLTASKAPRKITYSSGAKSAVINNVVIGDVFLVSGQSNMHMIASQAQVPPEDYNVDPSMLRLFDQSANKQTAPSESVNAGKWLLAEKNKAETFSAIGFMMGSILSKQTITAGVPIGIVAATVGGTSIEEWISADGYTGSFTGKNQLYNGMVAPLSGLAFSAAVWYQGENNSGYPERYKDLLKAYVADMRANLNDAALPFFVVQLPSYMGHITPSASGGAVTFDYTYLRDYQARAVAEINKCHLIVTMDKGDYSDTAPEIHPTDKRYIASRLSDSILKYVYSQDINADSPVITGDNLSQDSGKEIVLTLKNGLGLTVMGGNGAGISNAFEIAGADGYFYPADSVILGDNTITISSSKVDAAKYYRYAFCRAPMTLRLVANSGGLPLAPYRSYESQNGIVQENYRTMTDAELTRRYSFTPGVNPVEFSLTGEAERSLKIDYMGGALPNGNPYGEIRYYPLSALTLKGTGITDPNVLAITYKGANTGRKFKLAFTTPAYEIFRYELTDDSAETVTKYIPLDAFTQFGGTGTSVFNTSAIRQVTFNFMGASPMTIYLDRIYVCYKDLGVEDFSVDNVQKNGNEYVISWQKAVNATLYTVEIFEEGNGTAVYDIQSIRETFAVIDSQTSGFDFVGGKKYTVKVTALNEKNNSTNWAETVYERADSYTVNDFESYADDAALQADVTASINPGKNIRFASTAGAALTARLDTEKTSGKALGISYDKTGYHQVIFENFINPSSDFDMLSIWFETPENFEGVISLRVHDGVQSYELYTGGKIATDASSPALNIAGYSKKGYKIPLSEFWNKTTQSSIDNGKLTKIYLVINPTTYNPANNTVFIDDIKLSDRNKLAPYGVSFNSIKFSGWTDEILNLEYSAAVAATVDTYEIEILNEKDERIYFADGITETAHSVAGITFTAQKEYTIIVSAVNVNGKSSCTNKSILKGASDYTINSFENYADDGELLADSSITKTGAANSVFELADAARPGFTGKYLAFTLKDANPNLVLNLNGQADDKFDVLEYRFDYDDTYTANIFIRVTDMRGITYLYSLQQDAAPSELVSNRVFVQDRKGLVRIALSSFYQVSGIAASITRLKASQIKSLHFVFAAAPASKTVYFDSFRLTSFTAEYTEAEILSDFSTLPEENYGLMNKHGFDWRECGA